MERISKTICIDNSRSHRNGLLPFVPYGIAISAETEEERVDVITEVTSAVTNGNYGQYVCDFAVFDGDDNEIKRAKYLDIIKNYNFIQEQLRKSVFVKKYTVTKDEIQKIDCTTNTITTESSEVNIFRETFDELPYMSKYEFIPVDSEYFVIAEDHYEYVRPLEYENISKKEDPTEEEQQFLEKIDKIENAISSDTKFFVIIPNYDKVIEYNNKWSDVDTVWGWGWVKGLFSENPNTYVEDFEFCSDVDYFMLGKIEVISSAITGSKVPNYIYISEIEDIKEWFIAHSAETVTAYNRQKSDNEVLTENDKKCIAQWENMGGGAFHEFVCALTPKWQTKITEGEIRHCAPLIELSAIINAEIESETLYTPYEYSILSGNVITDAVYAYSAATSGVGSALKPDFIKYDSATTIKVESQLQTLIDPMAVQVYRDIFGVFGYFDESGVTGQMFECTYCTGWTEPYVYLSESTITYNYKDEVNEQGESTGEKKFESSGCSVSSTTLTEKCPSSEGAYQCCCVSVLSGRVETASSNTITEGDEIYPITRVIGKSFSSWTQYGWWKCVKTDKKLDCADGENVEPNSDYYRNVTIVSCIDNLVGKRKVGDTYYVLARFDNGKVSGETICDGEIHSLKIPYTVGKPLNIVTYSAKTESDIVVAYDMVISSVTSNDGYVDIEYVKGATSESTSGVTVGTTLSATGIHYKDRLTYIPNNFDIIPIDGVYPAELYYDKLDLEADKETIYSEEYVLKRKVLRSIITGMEVGTLWTEKDAVSAILFTKDGTEGLQEEPKEDINILYNRGNAAAWENHFKLSECNTMEDLENYGNNFFNL
jgi:hypothetical protein